ncbi:hypothetical protein [Amniculibacterium sp. G2-70]|uniref:hypothetical protein n=1 Tax=Amniculibacterium sp. G2-70 TaxID=2767188 RepID=UPI00165465DB|nr:hypothetical protein [Amniculibacterium sp. G2-70]
MKKLALGLLLTAGICGNAWASEGKIKEKIESNCHHRTVTEYYDYCGRFVGATYSPVVTYPCGEGQSENTIEEKIIRENLPKPENSKPCTNIKKSESFA